MFDLCAAPFTGNLQHFVQSPPDPVPEGSFIHSSGRLMTYGDQAVLVCVAEAGQERSYKGGIARDKFGRVIVDGQQLVQFWNQGFGTTSIGALTRDRTSIGAITQGNRIGPNGFISALAATGGQEDIGDYQRNGVVNVPSTSDGRYTHFETLPAHYITGKPRVIQNLFAVDGVDWTDVSNWAAGTGGGAVDSYSLADGLTISDLASNTLTKSVTLDVNAGVDIEGRVFGVIGQVKGVGASVGKTVRLASSRISSGVSPILVGNDITLTEDWQDVYVGPMTGNASNVGTRFAVTSGSSNGATTCQINLPGIIEWPEGADTSKPPMPEDIKCFVPVGVETYTVENALEGGADALTGLTTSPAGPVSVSQSAEVPPGFSYAASIETNSTPTSGGRIYDDIQDACSLVDGKDYVISVWARHNGTGGPWSVTTGNISLAGGTELVRLSDTDTTWTQYTTTITYSSAHQYFGAVEDNASQNGGVYLSGLSIRESAPGVYASDYTPNTVVLGGVIHDEELHWLELDMTTRENARTASNTGEITSGKIKISGTASAEDWTNGGNSMSFMGKAKSTNDRSYWLLIRGNGTFLFSTSSDGTSGSQVDVASIQHNMTPGIRSFSATLDIDQQTCTFEVDGVQLGSPVSAPVTSIFAGTGDSEVGGLFDGTSSRFNGLIFSASVTDGNGNNLETPFNAKTAIADGWTIHNAGGAAQIKTNKALPLHTYALGDVTGEIVYKAQVYEHFPLSTALTTTERYISSLANATYPNGSQGIYNQVEAFSNLIKPAARVDFAGEWTKIGTGSITPVGDAVDLARYTFDSTIEGWTTNGSATETASVENEALKLSWTGSGSAQLISPTLVGLSDGDWFVVNLNVTENNSGSIGILLRYRGVNYTLRGVSGTGEASVLLQYDSSAPNFTVGYSGPYSGSGDFSVDDVNYQKYSYTTLSDADDSINEMSLYVDTTIPNDNETYTSVYRLSEGTAATTTMLVQFRNGTQKSVKYTYSFATGVLTQDTDDTSSATATSTVNSDGTVDITITATDTGANTILRKLIYPASDDATTQGTVNVHGDVVLQRVSAAAEPTWNTLRPGDSVEQLIWPQQDLNTRWTQTNSPDVAQDETDVFGNENMAWTLGDSSAVAFTDVTQTPTTVKGETYCWGMAIKKVASVTAYPAIRVNDGGGGRDLSIDPVNGYAEFVALTADRYGIIDGTIVKALLPHWSNADNYWFVWASAVNGTDTTPSFKIFPAYSASFAGGSSAAAEGEIVIDMPFYHKGDYPHFFDSIATTATVTETVQDWSKIFTFLAEGSNNAVNAVFKHGFHRALGIPNVTALTNLSGDPYYPSTTSAQWAIGSNSFTSQTDVISIFPGEKAAQYVSNGTSGQIRDNIGTVSSGTETSFCIVEILTADRCIVRLRDTVVSNVYSGCGYAHSTGVATAQGIGVDAGAVALGKGPNGGDLVFIWGRGIGTTPGNARNLEIYPNGQGPVSGATNVIHYAGAVESDVVSILPWEGTRVAQTKWEYDASNRSNAEGTLLTDLTFTLGASDMAVNSNMAIFSDSDGSAEAMLNIDNSKRFRTNDGTVAKEVDTYTPVAQDVARVVMSYSTTENEHDIRAQTSAGAGSNTGTSTYDNAWVEPLNVFADTAYEAFLLNLILTKRYADATQRTAQTGYDV
jgi:hypothetical protein